jgi:hypothetical protein
LGGSRKVAAQLAGGVPRCRTAWRGRADRPPRSRRSCPCPSP